MTFPRVKARRFSGGEAVVNMAPMVGADVHRIDADELHGIDCLEHALDLRPAGLAQVNLAARPHKGHRRKGFAAFNCAQNIDAREGRCQSHCRPIGRMRKCCPVQNSGCAGGGQGSARRHRGRSVSTARSAFSRQMSSTWVNVSGCDPGAIMTLLRSHRGTRVPAKTEAFPRPSRRCGTL